MTFLSHYLYIPKTPYKPYVTIKSYLQCGVKNMKGTEKTQKPKVTIEDLESAMDICKKYFTKETLGDIQPEAKLALYAIIAEAMPDAVKEHMYAGLAVEYAKQADLAKEAKRHGEASVYQILAVTYLQKAGIQVPDMPGHGAGKDISQYMRSLFADKTDKQYGKKEE